MIENIVKQDTSDFTVEEKIDTIRKMQRVSDRLYAAYLVSTGEYKRQCQKAFEAIDSFCEKLEDSLIEEKVLLSYKERLEETDVEYDYKPIKSGK